MKTQTYLYKGPDSGATLAIAQEDGSTKAQEVMLFRGSHVQLPADHAYTQVLLAQGLIEYVTATTAAPTPAAPKTSSKSKE